MSEYNKFEVDDSAVISFIHSQNGCLGRAIVELITNAIDAQATECFVQINKHSFSVKDNGTGFGSKEDVMRYFKRFGTPHKKGDAEFGRFRVGRGQVMQFGTVSWKSNDHAMVTDIQNRDYGFDYHKLVGDKKTPGCFVEGKLYKELSEWNFSQAKRTIAENCAFLEMPIILNGIEVNKKDDDTLWDIENTNFRLKWNDIDSGLNGIRVYNKGSLVKEIPQTVYGLSADVVTKQALELNVSRNEIIETDPLWNSINAILLEESKRIRIRNSKTNVKMTESQRLAIIEHIEIGMISYNELINLPVLRDTRGKYLSISSLLSYQHISIAPNQNRDSKRLAETIITQRIAMVLHADECKVWRVNTLQALLDYVFNTLFDLLESTGFSKNYLRGKYDKLICTPFLKLAKTINIKHDLLSNKQLKKREVAAKNALQYASAVMSKRISNATGNEIRKRKIVIGESSTANGWTDSVSYIAIDRKMLSLLDTGRTGALQLATLMLHEYCHDSNNPDSDDHNVDFYERYHNLSTEFGKNEILCHTANAVYKRYNRQLITKFELLPKSVRTEFDWPVINELQMIECELTKKGLSPFARKVLEISGVTTKISTKKLIVSYPRDRYKDIPSRIYKFLNKTVLPETEMQPLNTFDAVKDWETQKEKVRAHTIEAATLWANKHNYDAKATVKLFSEHQHFTHLIRVICNDSQSGILAYKSLSLDQSITIGSPTYHFKNLAYHQVHGSTPDGYDPDMIDGMKSNKGMRMSFTVARIKEVILSLKNEDEKNNLLDRVFSPEFSEQFR